MKEVKQSTKKRIRRSQINLNPYNPKNHTEEQIKKQLQNIRKVGYLGGIVWNENTGNLIDGHRRIYALDLYYKYDKTNDYDVEVEAVEFDEKTEKEQMTYMAIANTKADLSIIATFIEDIDVSAIGADDDLLKEIYNFKEDDEQIEIPTYENLFEEDKDNIEIEELKKEIDIGTNALQNAEYEQKKQAVKEAKERQKQEKIQRSQDIRSYVVLSFDEYETKADMMEYFGYDPTETIIKGEEFLNKLKDEDITH